MRVATATSPAPSGSRLSSIDTLRGIVMVLMALDHVRDYFGVLSVSPTNLAQTTVPLFLTRWITHICAPTFFLLTGTGAFLARGRKSTGGAVAIPVRPWGVADLPGTDGPPLLGLSVQY